MFIILPSSWIDKKGMHKPEIVKIQHSRSKKKKTWNTEKWKNTEKNTENVTNKVIRISGTKK